MFQTPTPSLARQLSASDPQGQYGIPEDIVNAWKTAVQSKSKSAKTALFNAFLKSGKQWGQLLVSRILHACNKKLMHMISYV